MQCIAFDSHKHYTWALVQDEKGKVLREKSDMHRCCSSQRNRRFRPKCAKQTA